MSRQLQLRHLVGQRIAKKRKERPQLDYNFGKAEFIGMVDGYEKGDPQKVLGQNIWQSSIQIAGSSKRTPIAYTIDDKGRLSDVWVDNRD